MNQYALIDNEGFFVIDVLLSDEEIPTANHIAVLPGGDSGRYRHKWNGTEWVEGATPEFIAAAQVTPVPQSITRRQAKQVLLLDGWLDEIPLLLAAIPDPTQRRLAQIEWEDSQNFERNRPLLIAMAAMKGKTSADLDALFIQGASL